MDEQRVVLSDHQVESIANSAAQKAARDVFAILGVDIDKPESVEEFREDLRFGKRMRKTVDKSWFVFAGLVATAMGYLIWNGFVDAIRRMTGLH